MAGTMSLDDLVVDLKASLQLAAEAFKAGDDGDFKRHLNAAALAFVRLRPRTLVGSLSLIADQSEYAAPDDFHDFKSSLWGIGREDLRPWDRSWPGRLPVARVTEAAGVRQICLEPAPSAHQIGSLGPTFRYYYYAVHVLGETAQETTIRPGDRGLLLLRAQAEAVRELAMRNMNKPLQMRDGLNSQPRNGTPTYLFEVLMREFNEAVS